MKTIGLLDIDTHTSKKKWGATIYPNLALCKIAAFHKAQGDVVEWATPFTHYDILYRSKIFNFTPDDLTIYDADLEVRGGTGYDIHSTLPQEVDDMQPDLSIYPNIPADTSYGFLTRGCPNKCGWCVVPKKEGAIRPYWDIDRVANGRKKVVLMDNNILAAGQYGLDQLRKIIDRGYQVDFNQALDARLVNGQNAPLLARIKWIGNMVRFGCDKRPQVKECDRAIQLMRENGYKGTFMLYVMLDKFDETYFILNHWWEQIRFHKTTRQGVEAYPNAQPWRDVDHLNDPPQWQKDMARWCNSRSVFCTTPFGEYEPRHGFKCQTYFNQAI